MQPILATFVLLVYLTGTLPGPGSVVLCLGSDGHLAFGFDRGLHCHGDGDPHAQSEAEAEAEHAPCADLIIAAFDQHQQPRSQPPVAPPTLVATTDIVSFPVACRADRRLLLGTRVRPPDILADLACVILVI